MYVKIYYMKSPISAKIALYLQNLELFSYMKGPRLCAQDEGVLRNFSEQGG